MKHFNLLFVILAAGLFMTSCKKEDAKKTPESELLGKWKGEKTISTVFRNEIAVESDTTFFKVPDFFTVEFKKNNKCSVISSSEGELDSENLFYKIEEDKIILDEDEKYPEPEIYSFKLNGKKLVLKRGFKQQDAGSAWEFTTEMHFTK